MGVIDPVAELLVGHPGVVQAYEDAIGVTYTELHADPAASLSRIVDKFGLLSGKYDAIVVVGSDYTDVTTGNEWASNAQIAANIGSPVVLVVHGRGRDPQDDRRRRRSRPSRTRWLARPSGGRDREPGGTRGSDRGAGPALPVPGWRSAAIPEIPLLVAPTVANLQQACGAELVRGNPELLQKESMGFVVAAMSLPNVLTRLTEDCTVIAPGDRSELLPALILAHQSGTFPNLAAIMLTGGYPPAAVGAATDRRSPAGPADPAHSRAAPSRPRPRWPAVRGRLTAGSAGKLETALRVFGETVDTEALLAAIDVAESDVVTPLMFQYRRVRAGQGRPPARRAAGG